MFVEAEVVATDQEAGHNRRHLSYDRRDEMDRHMTGEPGKGGPARTRSLSTDPDLDLDLDGKGKYDYR